MRYVSLWRLLKVVLATLLLIVGLYGCRAHHEEHVIVPIPRHGDAMTRYKYLAGGGNVLGNVSERQAANWSKAVLEQFRGIWLARFVFKPSSGEGRYLSAIEILFCPSESNDFTKCRVGVAWSATKNPLGEYESSR